MKTILVKDKAKKVEVIAEHDMGWGWTYQLVQDANGHYYVNEGDDDKHFIEFTVTTDDVFKEFHNDMEELIEEMNNME